MHFTRCLLCLGLLGQVVAEAYHRSYQLVDLSRNAMAFLVLGRCVLQVLARTPTSARQAEEAGCNEGISL